jgi:hypothetical protein
MSKVVDLTPEQIAFEIRFALGQAGASLFIGAHSKSPEVRLKALAQLTQCVAARFINLRVQHELPEGWDRPLCGNGG